MAQLTGNPIQSSYLGLIKTNDNAAIGGSSKALSDGAGNAINMEIGTGAIKFPSGTVDFTGSTVQGLPSGGGTVSFYGTPWTLSTQAAADLVYETFTIPGGTFTTGDIIEISTLEYRDGLNNWGYSSLWISDTAQTVGQAPAGGANNFSLAQKQSPSSRLNVYYNKRMFIKSNGTMFMPIAGTNNVTAENSSDPTETYNINWANDQYFYYQLWNDSTTGTYTTSGTFLRKLN
jgi:hypothetical protein